MTARLFARLVAVLAFVFTMSVAPAAHASPLTVSASCVVTGPYAPDPANYATFSCTANPSGGTGSYSYYWTVFTWCCGDQYWASTQTITGNCKWNTVRIFNVYVTDSSGAATSASATANCRKP
ncbi:MAG TPA: hypothetical protein VF612_02010 [Jatrophihabitans sp.]|jgi:hypothetical protein|uniref:hypothetical protein n=1 Tax=Jatrophihabitans sp. TaxID=1932789 RepID=UPI002F01F365